MALFLPKRGHTVGLRGTSAVPGGDYAFMSSPVSSSHRGHRVAAAETHPPASFSMMVIDEYKLLLASICPHLFVNLGFIISSVPAQFEFYVDYESFKLLFFKPSCKRRSVSQSSQEKGVSRLFFLPPRRISAPREINPVGFRRSSATFQSR